MPTRYRGNATEKRALNAYISLQRAAVTIESCVHSEVNRAGLTIRQFAVLEAVYHLGPMEQESARKLLCTSGNLTGVIGTLERMKLVIRTQQKDDRRCYHVSLTPRGKDIVEKLFPAHVKRIVRSLSAISVRDQEALRRISRKLGRAVAGVVDA